MILIFDLDDTLYPEITYVKSGFLNVSKFLSDTHGLNSKASYFELLKILKRQGRGQVFDSFLRNNLIYSKKNLRSCISVYRGHKPSIQLYSDAKRCIKRFRNYKKYIVTDGNVRVQRKKIHSLGLMSKFDKVIPTYQYGLSHSKPSLLCFNKIMHNENCNPSDMLYVGDNPYKDFVNLKKKGIRTVRVLRGSFKSIKLHQEYEAEFSFKNLDKLTYKFVENLYENR